MVERGIQWTFSNELGRWEIEKENDLVESVV
jgi:hypothetical protein